MTKLPSAYETFSPCYYTGPSLPHTFIANEHQDSVKEVMMTENMTKLPEAQQVLLKHGSIELLIPKLLKDLFGADADCISDRSTEPEGLSLPILLGMYEQQLWMGKRHSKMRTARRGESLETGCWTETAVQSKRKLGSVRGSEL
jgi:hypothetical protein